MKVFALGSGIAATSDLQAKAEMLIAKPSFRKASANMKLAYLSAMSALQEGGLDFTHLKNAGFVLGSSYGELIQTKEFLKSWAKEKLARPLLFQSSLHNGTLGFLSLEFGLQGPSFTVSHHHLTGEKSLELGMNLILDGAAEIVLVSAVEVMDPDLFPSLKCRLPSGVEWRDGAASVILVSENWLRAHHRVTATEIKNIYFRNRDVRKNELGISDVVFSGNYYDSDGLEKWIIEIRKSLAGDHSANFLKLDGQETQVEWRKS